MPKSSVKRVDSAGPRSSSVVYQFGDLPGVLRIESAEALKALSNPVRAAILKELGAPASIKEVAATMGLPTARLYHHFRQLAEHQLIIEAGRRKAGSNSEVLYRVAAGRIEVSAELTGPWRLAADDVGTMVETTARRFADAFRAEEQRRSSGEAAGPIEPWFVEAVVHLDAEQTREVRAKLQAVITEVSKVARRAAPGTKTPSQERLGLQLAFVPFPPARERRYAEYRADTPPDNS